MIESFIKNPHLVRRLKARQIASSIDDLAAYLSRQGYSFWTAKNYLPAAGHFSYWVKSQDIPLESVDEATAHTFLFHHLKQCSCPGARGGYLGYYRPALKHFLAVLRQHHLIARAEEATLPASHTEKILQDFAEHTEKVHGLALSTIHVYLKHIRGFIRATYRDGPIDFHRLDNNDVKQYVCARAAACKPSTTGSLTASLRGFLRFLRITHHIERSLEDAVPRVPHRRLSTIPQYLTKPELERLLSSFDVSTSNGLRDRAMALLMARLGLRAVEVSQLRLEDIQWREGTITIQRSKSRRAFSLPLPKEAGEALAAYLKRGRPHSKERRVFLIHTLPTGRPFLPSAVGDVIRRASRRCGLVVPRYGSHILRHTLATHLLHRGATLKQIADVLRHRSIETTAIYAKVDLGQLVQVALPWPEVKDHEV